MQIHFKNQQKSDRLLDLTRPNIMGILNFTPDSFSDSGKFFVGQSSLPSGKNA